MDRAPAQGARAENGDITWPLDHDELKVIGRAWTRAGFSIRKLQKLSAPHSKHGTPLRRGTEKSGRPSSALHRARSRSGLMIIRNPTDHYVFRPENEEILRYLQTRPVA
jgi:hypothetical protein